VTDLLRPLQRTPSGTDASNATAAAAVSAGTTASADATAGDWDAVCDVVAEKLAPVVQDALAATAAAGDSAGDRAAGNVGGRTSTRLAHKKATQGGRVEKQLNKKSKDLVNLFIRDWVNAHPDDGTFRKKGKWQIRRQSWGTFLDHIRSRADLTVDKNGAVNMKKKAAPRVDCAPRAAPIVPSATIRSPTPQAAGPSNAGPSTA